jgi:hypothetical protein
MEDGVTGFIVDDLEESVRAVERVARLSRARCREAFERRFSAARMAQDYLTIYRRLVRGGRAAASAPATTGRHPRDGKALAHSGAALERSRLP